jgi:hypothetical protein
MRGMYMRGRVLGVGSMLNDPGLVNTILYASNANMPSPWKNLCACAHVGPWRLNDAVRPVMYRAMKC